MEEKDDPLTTGEAANVETWGMSEVDNISPYHLLPAPTVFIHGRDGRDEGPISELPKCLYGIKFADGTKKFSKTTGGGLVLNEERVKRGREDPIAKNYIKPYINAKEFLEDKNGWCLWLKDSTPTERESSPFIKESLDIVKKAREEGDWKDNPAWLPVSGEKNSSVPYLTVPCHFSKKYCYIPAGYVPSEKQRKAQCQDVIASNAFFTIDQFAPLAFSIVESSMLMAWEHLTGGNIKQDPRFEDTLVWNTFPLPTLTKDQKDLIIDRGEKVLEARKKYSGLSLEKLYTSDNIKSNFPDLYKAHQALDEAVDNVFPGHPFKNERERQKALLEAYQRMTEEKEE